MMRIHPSDFRHWLAWRDLKVSQPGVVYWLIIWALTLLAFLAIGTGIGR